MLGWFAIWAFDEFLTWGRHVQEAVATTQRRLWALRCYVGHHWGLDPYIFLSIIRHALLP